MANSSSKKSNSDNDLLKNELVYSANVKTNNLTLIDERKQLQDLGYTTFNSSRNFTDLYMIITAEMFISLTLIILIIKF